MALRMTEEEYVALMARRRAAVNRAERMMDRAADTSIQTAHDSTVPLSAGCIPDEKTKRQKYGNRRVEIDGKKFDSQHEAAVYQQLMLRVRAGELVAVLRQVPFDIPGGIRYFADFVTIAPGMRIEGVYDAKSDATKANRVYINKKKQMKSLYGIDINEV